MCRTLSGWLLRVSTGPVTLAAWVVFLVFAIVVLPGQAAAARDLGGGAGSPDTSFFYVPDDLYRLADAYGNDGRDAYVRARWTFDLAFPMVYGVALVTAISWLVARLSAKGNWLRLANLAPVWAVVLDYLENSCTSLVMVVYPTRVAALGWLAALFTATKWVFVIASMVLVVVFAALWLWGRMVKRGERP